MRQESVIAPDDPAAGIVIDAVFDGAFVGAFKPQPQF